jgi:hypothetical protein
VAGPATVAALAAPAARAEEPSVGRAALSFPWTGTAPTERALVAAEWTRGVDPSGEEMHGVRLGLGSWNEVSEGFKGRGLWYVSASKGESQRVYRAGFDAGWPWLFHAGPFRLVPMRVLGELQYRGDDPDAGFAGALGLGAEAAVWLAPFLQVAAGAQRTFGAPVGTESQITLGLRLSPRSFLGHGVPP